MTATLSAWSIERYGAPGRLIPVTRPHPEPGPTEVLIRIRALAVTRADGMMRAGRPLFAVGAKVRRFAVGDAVFGEAGLQPPEALRGHLGHLLAMIGTGALSPVLDRVYPLADLVAAHAHMETGHKRGNMVVV